MKIKDIKYKIKLKENLLIEFEIEKSINNI